MSVKKNIFMLLIVQGVNYLFPLLTFSYISRILGPENFGKIGLAQSIIIYFTFVVDFGFNLIATRNISFAFSVKDQATINKIYSETIAAKFILAIISFFIIILISFLFNQLKDISFLLIIGSLTLIGNVFFPIWLFQGIQKMGSMALLSTITKLVSVLLVFITVNERNDLNWAMFSQSLGGVISAGFSLYMVKKLKYAIFVKVKINEILKSLKNGFPIFLSYIFSSIYTTLNLFICSFFISAKDLGFYASADRLRQISQTVIVPVQQGVYPHISGCVDNKKIFFNQLFKYGAFLTLVGLLISLGLYFFSNYIVLLLLGNEYLAVNSILKILSIVPFLISLSIVFGQWGLINLNKEKTLSKVYIVAGLVHLIHIFIFLKLFGVLGAAYSIVITESLVSLVLIICFFRICRKC